MIAKYVLVVEEFPLALQAGVNKLIGEDYSPLGGIGIYAGSQGQRLAQAMVKNDETSNKAVTLGKAIVPALINLESESYCDHEFFKCQVPAGDSCVAIYHQVCRKCRWDERKGIYMPLDIWQGWAVPQLEKLDN